MKVELVALMRGDLQLEVIAETECEYRLLERAWQLNGYKHGNGRSHAPGGGKTGFYIPLCSLVATSQEKPEESRAELDAAPREDTLP